MTQDEKEALTAYYKKVLADSNEPVWRHAIAELELKHLARKLNKKFDNIKPV